MWDGLTSDERDRLIRNLRKIETSSHFTGLGSFELILHRIISEVNEHCVSDIPDNRSRHCCDHDTSRQRVLTSYHKCHRPHHVYSDISDRLTDEQKATINSMKLADCARVAEKREANVNIRKYLFEIFEQGKVKNSAWCAVHNRDCRLWKSSLSPWHGEDSDSDEDGEPPLSFHGAGVICKDATNQGTLNGDVGKQMPLQHCWTAERRQRREDLIIVECTPLGTPICLQLYA